MHSLYFVGNILHIENEHLVIVKNKTQQLVRQRLQIQNKKVLQHEEPLQEECLPSYTPEDTQEHTLPGRRPLHVPNARNLTTVATYGHDPNLSSVRNANELSNSDVAGSFQTGSSQGPQILFRAIYARPKLHEGD